MESVIKPNSRKPQVNISSAWKKTFRKEHSICGLFPNVLKKMLLVLLLQLQWEQLKHSAKVSHLCVAGSLTVLIRCTTNCSRLDNALPGMLLFPFFSVSFGAGCVFSHIPRYHVLSVILSSIVSQSHQWLSWCEVLCVSSSPLHCGNTGRGQK